MVVVDDSSPSPSACCCSARRHSRSRTDSANAKLQPQNSSGESGTATLTKSGANQTKVVLEVKGAPSGAQPVHIHKGTCAKLDPKPAYPLARREREIGDRGQRLAGQPPEGVRDQRHKSAQDVSTYVFAATSAACRGRPGARRPGPRPPPWAHYSIRHVTPRAAQASPTGPSPTSTRAAGDGRRCTTRPTSGMRSPGSTRSSSRATRPVTAPAGC